MQTPTRVPRWYAVHTKPHQESRVDANLQRWGIQTLAPKIPNDRRRSTRASARSVMPLFPGYLFARFAADLALSKVKLVRGVHSVVGFGEGATPIDDGIIATIQGRLDDEGLVRPLEPKPGDSVRVISGPFQQLEGVFEGRVRGTDRVVVLLAAIGAQPRINVSQADVRICRRGW